MLFSFGNLLSVFIVLIILIVYRQLDRNNRSIEKVKKYSDRIKDDIAALVDQKTVEMKNLAIELQVNLKTGKEVLKKVHESEEALAQRAKGIDEVRVRLDGYDRALEELVDMTAGVEENLKRIQSESVFVDKVGRRIAGVSEKLERVEQSLGKTEQRFLQQSREQLAVVRTEVAQDSERKIGELAGLVADSEQRIKDFGTYITRLEARGEELEREVLGRLTRGLEHLEAEAKGKRTTVLTQFVASLNKLLGDADARSKVLKSNLNHSAAEAESRLTEHQKRLEEVVKQGEAMEGTVFAGLKELIAKDSEAVRHSSAALHRKLEESKALRVQLSEQMQGLHKDAERVRQESLKHLERAAEEMQVAALARAEKQLEGYEKQIDYRFRKLEEAGGDIDVMEKNLRELVERTAANVREEFGRFTRSFEEERNAERTRVEEELGQIRVSMGELQEDLTGLKGTAYENVSAQLQVFEDEFFKDLRGRNQAIEKRLEDWQTDLEARMEQVRTTEVHARSVLEKRFTQEIEKQVDVLRHASFEQLNGLGARVAAFEATLEGRLGESDAKSEELVRSISNRIERSRQELDIAYQKQLDTLKERVNERVNQIGREADERVKAMEVALGAGREEILNVSERITELQRDLAVRSEAAVEELHRNVEAFGQEFSRRSAEMQSEVDSRSQELKARLAEIRDRSESLEAGLIAKIDEGQKLLNLTLADLDKRVKSFVSQTKVFERADDLKTALEGRIDDMKRDMDKLQAQRKEMEALETRIGGMKRTADEVGGKLAKVLSERARVDDMDSDFKKLLAISRELDRRVETVYSSQDALQEIQAKIRNLEELEKTTEGRFDRLEKKKAIIEATTTGVDKNFEQLQALDKTLSGFRQELSAVSEQLSSLKSHSELLSNNREKTDLVAQKIQDLDGILGDLEGRMEKLETAREWLAKTETRFENVGKQAQEQVRLLESILKSESKQSKLGEGAPPMDKRETVTKLAHLGWSPVEIARTTKLSRGEVELILELAPRK